MKEKYKLMTLKEVQKVLKVSRTTMWRLLKQGRIPAFKIGGQWRFRYGDVMKYFFNLLVLRPRFFKLGVLDKYRNNPKEWFLREDKEGGWIAERTGKENGVQLALGPPNSFRFTRTLWPTGDKVIRIMPGSFSDLPYKELYHWLAFEIRK